MDDFIQGMFYPLKGARYLFTDGLKRFILLPILFNFMLFSSLFYLIYHHVVVYSKAYLAQLPWWLNFAHNMLLIIFVVGFFLLSMSVFTVVFNLIAAPFNGLLAEKAQAILYRTTIPPLPFHIIALRSIKRQCQFIGYFFPRFVGMCLLFFVPFVNAIFPLLWFFFNAWMLSFQYHDFAMDNNLVDFKTMRKQLKDNKLHVLGFGSMVNLIGVVPALNLLIMPAAVIGSVIFYCERSKSWNDLNLLIKISSDV